MDALVDYLRNRLREPSTWRGILLLITALGVSIRPDLWEAIVTLGIALAGGVGAFTPDRVPVQDRSDDPHADLDRINRY